MLKEIFIKNYALIDEITLRFSPNLTILSGETGAGKSIIIGALGLILGQKGKTSLVRTGEKNCVVEGRFAVSKDHPVWKLLDDMGIPGDDEDLVIRRVITSTGLSRSVVNGFQVSVRDLQDITSYLIDIHGQHEHQSLLNVKTHLKLLDKYGKLDNDLMKYRTSYTKLVGLGKKLSELIIDEKEKERRIDMLRFAIDEIEEANLREGEDEQLEQEYRVQKNYEEIVSAVSDAYRLIVSGESSVLEKLDEAIARIEKVSNFLQNAGEWLENIQNARVNIEETGYSMRGFLDGIEYEPGKIDVILSRLDKISRLKKKYGDTIKEVLQYAERARTELESLETRDEEIESLKKEIERVRAEASKLAVSLSAQRRVVARALEESIQKELSYLGLEKAKIKVAFSYKESPDGEVKIEDKRYKLLPDGLDNVEFLISTNVGQPLMPLKSVASGGELSRIMLAIKTVLGSVDPIDTFVFDEIDVGIGGKIAWAVGNRLKELSKTKQIVCITHQAQIASRGDLNIRVEKEELDNRAITRVKELDEEEKVKEIARMLSGKTITEAAIKQAKEMIMGK